MTIFTLTLIVLFLAACYIVRLQARRIHELEAQLTQLEQDAAQLIEWEQYVCEKKRIYTLRRCWRIAGRYFHGAVYQMLTNDLLALVKDISYIEDEYEIETNKLQEGEDHVA